MPTTRTRILVSAAILQLGGPAPPASFPAPSLDVVFEVTGNRSDPARGDVFSAALTLTVADDGKGVPDGVEEKRGSLGLLGMRERAELLGGHFNITTPETGGTRVTAVLPWRRS